MGCLEEGEEPRSLGFEHRSEGRSRTMNNKLGQTLYRVTSCGNNGS